MLRRRLSFVVILAHVTFLGDGRTIQNRTSKFDVADSTAKTLDRQVDEGFDYEAIQVTRSKSVAASRDVHVEHSNEKKPKLSKRNDLSRESCPYGSKELCLILSLSKIANVQVAAPDRTSPDRSPMAKMFRGASRNTPNWQVDRTIKENDRNLQDFTKEPTKSPNVHCRAIRDVYIPEVKQNLPAYDCKFGNNTFVLSSARFLQDRRQYLDVNVNENTFKTMRFTPKFSRSNEVNVIPALLVLNVVNNDYRIEMHRTSNERKVNQLGGKSR
ncbi:uncharacterized protein LOC143149221 [Ptiloglossa arizonensis]|uniref:uncharacterized protein LOC143149221 n=1 Tax=Ptiloglossa arizonensis TaxID=3350558 RepID=UPI003FA129CF